MAYFSNGTEGMLYEEQWCGRCIHGQDQEKGCTIWDLHMLYNYDECNNKDSMLHILIPMGEDGFAGECSMFTELQKELEQLRAELDHLRRKVEHGCIDALCSECDEP